MRIEEALAIVAGDGPATPKLVEVKTLSFDDLKIVEEIEEWRREAGGPYHWKHGWIPLDHIAAVKKYGSAKAAAAKGFLPPSPPKARTPRTPAAPRFLRNVRRIENPSHADAMKGSNPDFNRNKVETTINCAKVAQVYELRRRGYDVKATPGPAMLLTDALANMWKGPDKRTPKVVSSKNRVDLEDYMEGEGPGARFCVTVTWKGTPPGAMPTSAHMFNAETQADGSIKYFDAQVGTANAEWYWDNVDTQWSSSKVFRVDNAEPRQIAQKKLSTTASDIGGLIQAVN